MSPHPRFSPRIHPISTARCAQGVRARQPAETNAENYNRVSRGRPRSSRTSSTSSRGSRTRRTPTRRRRGAVEHVGDARAAAGDGRVLGRVLRQQASRERRRHAGLVHDRARPRQRAAEAVHVRRRRLDEDARGDHPEDPQEPLLLRDAQGQPRRRHGEPVRDDPPARRAPPQPPVQHRRACGLHSGCASGAAR